jgi:hypothetical protein
VIRFFIDIVVLLIKLFFKFDTTNLHTLPTRCPTRLCSFLSL